MRSAILLLFVLTSAQAATWNDLHGMGGDDAAFGGCGAPIAVVTSVHSNALYWIANGNAGATCWERVLVKSDLPGFAVDFYVATNSWLLASNQMAGTNILWLSTTNAGLATNDLLAYAGAALQLTILSGNATDAAGLVTTNALGQCAVKIFNPLTNAVTAGEAILKLARVQRFNPLSDHAITNKVISPLGNWLNLSDLYNGQSINLQAKAGQLSAIVMTYSNAAGLQIAGKKVK